MAATAREVARLVEQAHRRHWSAVLASTVRLTRDLDLAEDCAQEAYVSALRTWPDGAPDNPAAWLTRVSRNAALDRLRREETLRRKLPLLLVDEGPAVQPTDPLRLIFTCCHPALAPEAQVALTLRLMCGLSTTEVAAGLLVKEATAAARITRAKQKIAAAGIPFRIPSDNELPARLDTVLTVLHLVFTAGHTAAGSELTRPDLTARAVDLGRMLGRLMPGEREVEGLVALLLLGQARGAARLGEDGELVLLADQDRTRWDRRLIAEGMARATRALTGPEPGRFALQAAIAGLHCSASAWQATDWARVVVMYDGLMRRWPSPIVALNRAAARSLVPGADLVAVLAELDELAKEPALAAYAYLPATRADVLARLGRNAEAGAAYDAALGLTPNDKERRFLRRRREALR